MRIAAAALGWGLVLLDGISDSAIAGLFGLSRGDNYGPAEREEPELLALVTSGLPSTSPRLLNGLTAGSTGARWCFVPPNSVRSGPSRGRVVALPRVGGLHGRYSRGA
jgi:hypothetical protein